MPRIPTHIVTIARRTLRELFRSALDVLAPPRCPACGLDSDGLCAGCAHRLESRHGPCCERCGEPALPMVPCVADHARITGLAWARAAFAYRGTAADLVHRLKFARDPAALRFLVARMAKVAESCRSGSRRRCSVVAVPLHPRKLRRRGFDQAAALAAGVAHRLGLQFEPGVLARVRETLPQGDPRVLSRERNISGAFAVVRPRAVEGRSVWLVDDVTTSGATARACAKLLREAGAAEVGLLTAAHA
jgi:ComF family protein